MDPDFIAYPWFAVGIIWLVTAFSSKRTVQKAAGKHRVLEVVCLWLSFNLLFSKLLFRHGVLAWRFVPDSVSLPWVGLGIELAGMAFTVWARLYLGSNWSAAVTIKENHQLMRGGPYGIVRHPIYAGMIFAFLGTAVAIGEVRGILAAGPPILAWRYKAGKEEALMIQQFGDEYERYRCDVKGLIPFLW